MLECVLKTLECRDCVSALLSSKQQDGEPVQCNGRVDDDGAAGVSRVGIIMLVIGISCHLRAERIGIICVSFCTVFNTLRHKTLLMRKYFKIIVLGKYKFHA